MVASMVIIVILINKQDLNQKITTPLFIQRREIKFHPTDI